MAKDLFKAFHNAGYKVYMRNEDDNHCYFTDGRRIGYAEYRPYSGYGVHTVHKPNRYTGTGYTIEKGVSAVSTMVMETALNTLVPSWARVDQHSIKYSDWEAYISESDFNAGLKEVLFD